MSEYISRPQHVQVTKLNSTTTPPTTPPTTQQQTTSTPQQSYDKYDIAQDSKVTNPSYTPIPTTEITDTESDSNSESEYTYGDTSSDSESDTETDQGTETHSNTQEGFVGGKPYSDTDTTSSVSTTDILSRDPLFLVLSEFLMDESTGNNIIHVGNNLVNVLNKINSKLGRIADAIEQKKQKRKDTRNHKD